MCKLSCTMSFHKHFSLFLLSFFLVCNFYSIAQSATDSSFHRNPITIGNIIITGNKKTKNSIIFREIPFKTGDTIARKNFATLITKAKQNLINTSLFNFVTIDTSIDNMLIATISVNVKERWYTWPNPIFEISERNFNTWLENRNLDRVSYGFYIVKNNFRGRKENIQLRVRLGYAEQYGMSYNIPYLTKKQNFGLGFSFAYARNHEIQYKTLENKQKFFKNTNKYVREELSGRVRLSYREGIYTTKSFELRYNFAKVSDTIQYLAKNYFSNNSNYTEFFSMNYQFRRDERDNKPYPLNGYYFSVDIAEVGFGILKKEDFQLWRTDILLNKYAQIHNRFYAAAGLKLTVTSAAEQPYFLQRGLGFSDFVRGYEYYVIDGQDYGLLKTNIKYQLVKPRVIKMDFVPSEKFNNIHYAFYVNLFADAAYVYDNQYYKENFLANKFLFGSGVGLDFVTYYDLVFRAEFAVNGLKQTGLFLHLTAPI